MELPINYDLASPEIRREAARLVSEALLREIPF